MKYLSVGALALALTAAALIGRSTRSTAGGVNDPGAASMQRDVATMYAAFRSAPLTSDTAGAPWAARITRSFGARGDVIDPANIRRAVDASGYAVDAFVSEKELCFRVAEADGSGSINCVGLKDAADEAAVGGLVAVDKTADGMRATLFAPDGTRAVRLSTPGAGARDVPMVNNAASVETAARQGVLTWTDPRGQMHTQSVSMP